MLQFTILDLLFILPYWFSICFLTLLYFQFNVLTTFIKGTSTDKKNVKTFSSKKNHNITFLRFIIVLFILMQIQLLLFRGYSGSFWCNHLFLNNFSIKYLIFFSKLSVFVIFIVYCLALSRVFFSVDYIYSIGNLFIISPLIFLSNNFFVFYFLLELIVCLTFFKFVVSRFWYKDSYNFYKKASAEKYADYTPKMFVNALFFQYWVSFFSSILLLLFFINLEFYFSSTDWVFLNLATPFYELPVSFYLYFFLFVIAFFLKLGITPLHLYKVEVYKGLPYISLYIYTLIFFFIYFIFFVTLLLTYFYIFISYIWISLVLLLVIGVVYVVCMLFDINFIKSFFAYSTIINSLSFLLVVLSCF